MNKNPTPEQIVNSLRVCVDPCISLCKGCYRIPDSNFDCKKYLMSDAADCINTQKIVIADQIDHVARYFALKEDSLDVGKAVPEKKKRLRRRK